MRLAAALHDDEGLRRPPLKMRVQSGQALGDSSSDRVRTNSILYSRLLILTRRGFLLACMSNLFNTGSDVGNLGKHRIQAHGPDNGANTSRAWMSQFVRAKGTHDSDRPDRAPGCSI